MKKRVIDLIFSALSFVDPILQLCVAVHDFVPEMYILENVNVHFKCTF
jgi:hypothetical protein